ncbi:hypothetical protein J1N35_036456 [Gossypium stocksii]|uniref:Uncharacterized protein n=1 Tax=Gossypium stocksii TaxID=47602 RepID=A0A9D3UI13_9ROSI|nr:hypothetical protein J1N35_036456 [Gossypium stocksii]
MALEKHHTENLQNLDKDLREELESILMKNTFGSKNLVATSRQRGTKLFTLSDYSGGLICIKSHFPMLDPTTIDALKRPVSNDDIKRALLDMAPLKALRVDGFHEQIY